MTNQDARDYLEWHRKEQNKYHFLARFKSTKPFLVDYPDSVDKKNEALIKLGLHQWQRPYESLLKIYPNLTIEKYLDYRKKHKIDN